MASATLAERQRMDEALAAIESQYLSGVVKQGLAQASSARALLTGPILAQLPFFRSDAQEHAARLLAEVQPRLTTWRDKWRKWAEKGARDDGTPYTVERWLQFGRDLASQIQQATQQAWEESLFGFATFSAENTVKMGKKAADYLAAKLPGVAEGALFWLKVGGVVLALGGAAYVVRAFK